MFILLFFQAAYPASCEEKTPDKPGTMRVTPRDIVLLTLKNNRTINNAYLDRKYQKYTLKVAEDKFIPNLDIIVGPEYSETRSVTSRKKVVRGGSITPTFTLKIPTGAQFTYRWQNTLEVTNFFGQDTKNYRTLSRDRNSLTDWDMTMTASITQPLLKGGGIKSNTASVKIAQLQEEINKLELKSIIIDTITSSILSYRSLLQAHRQVEIDQRSLERAKELLKVNKSMVEIGRMAKLDLVQTETDIASKELDLLISRNDLQAARLDLMTTIDIQKDTQIIPVEEFDVQPVQLDDARLTDLALKNEPDYLQALFRVNIADLNLIVAENNRLWDLSLKATHSTTASSENIGDTYRMLFDEYSLEASLLLTIPIGDLTRKNLVIQRKVELQKARVNLNEVRETIEINVEDKIRDVRINIQRIELARQTRELSEKKLEVEKQRLGMGRTSNFELVRFQNDLVTAQNDELKAKISYLNSLTSLDQVLGATLDSWQVTIED